MESAQFEAAEWLTKGQVADDVECPERISQT